MANICKVLVVDDHPLFRKGAAQLLELDDEFQLIGEAASGAEGIDLAAQLQPDLILLDLEMQDMSGIDVLRHLKDSESDAIIVVLTVSNSENVLVAALRYGADGYLLKDLEPEEILKKLRRAASGQLVLDDSVSAILAKTLGEDNRTSPIHDPDLTDREAEVLTLIAEGKSNKRIALDLGISDGTVKVHVKNLLRKLGVRSRLEAAVWSFGQKPGGTVGLNH